MAPVLSRSLATAPLTSFPLNNINNNRRVLNLRNTFVPLNGLRKGFSCSGLKWKLEKRGSRVGVRCEAGVAEKEAPDTPGEKFEYQAEVSRLLDLIVHSLYSHKEVFLRELVSNASDALDKLRFLSVTEPSLLGDAGELEIRIKPDPDNGTITITDTGIGMTKEELIDCLGTIAQSGTSKFLKALKENQDLGADNGLIGQFGVGFYSAFLVAEKVTVSTKSPRSEKQYVWEAVADSSSYVIREETDPEKSLPRGTQITLYLRPDDKYEFSEPSKIQSLVKNYSQFVSFPIYTWQEKSRTVEVEEEEEPKEGEEAKPEDQKKKKKTITEKYWDWELANETKPIWMRNPREVEKDEYNDFYKKTFNEFLDPLSHIHFTTEGEVEFRSILYIPGMGPLNNEDVMNPKTKNIRLYVKRVFISDDFDECIEVPFVENEIHSALMEMNGDKAPGPDGFSVAFWQNAWAFAKEEIMEMFKEFHEHSTFVRSLNNTFLVLIPKKSGCAKCLCNGRQILDASLIANEVLQKMGFGNKWVGWMWSCVSSAKFSVLVNGVPAGFFPSSRGLRQGDPLSPYLFVMGMEILDVLIRRAVEGGQTKIKSLILAGFSFGLKQPRVFGGVLALHYLGLPLGVPNRASSMWDGVEERIRRRLALWKRQYISKGGRITLIKSALASMPIYQMSIFRMPKSVARRVEKIQRDFLWGGGNLGGKIHLVKWDVVCTEKRNGGLGLRRIATLNRALLGKWIWRFACERDNLWKQVISTKYGQEDYGWRAKKVSGAAGVGVWKEIMKESDWCWENLSFLVGKGSKIKFWKDRWCTDTPLSQCFNHLFVLAVHRDASIEEMWDHHSGQGDWNLIFERDFNDWELDMVGDLLRTLRGHRPSLEDDSIKWRQGRKGSFRVKEAYSLLDKSNASLFPARGIWVDRVPTKVSFFAWEATWGKVLTLDKLQIRGVQLPNCCFLCGCAEENVNHILLHCIVARALWDIIFGLLDIKWVFPETVKEALTSWRGSFVGKKRKQIWKSIPLCIFWTVWKERNRLAFRGGVVNVQRLKNSFVCNLWNWAKVYLGEEAFSLIGFLEWIAST
ncbi:Heat shock protein 90-5, chloroplastic [Vitis vinifera]|uniref:Heat shock protein 90-5, chloroplastic n=1 Tax=Vitis vinifera TaxID=29760 RepID=A0A438EAD8_VITVI|nr:Heat shock protein 90-5, chloroplastic [Vitis vinifera]